jgi:hypothetical protein
MRYKALISSHYICLDVLMKISCFSSGRGDFSRSLRISQRKIVVVLL